MLPGLTGRSADAEHRMHHYHKDDAEALGVVDPVDPPVMRLHATHGCIVWLILAPVEALLWRMLGFENLAPIVESQSYLARASEPMLRDRANIEVTRLTIPL